MSQELTPPGHIPTYELKPEDIENIVMYQQLHITQSPQGGFDIEVVEVPLPRDLINGFNNQFAEALADVNIKLVTVKGKLFLAPAKTSSLIGFKE